MTGKPVSQLRVGGQVVVLVAVVLVGAFFVFLTGRRLVLGPAYDEVLIQNCRGQYQAARTAADSSRVDRVAPIQTKTQAAQPITCGEARKIRGF